MFVDFLISWWWKKGNIHGNRSSWGYKTSVVSSLFSREVSGGVSVYCLQHALDLSWSFIWGSNWMWMDGWSHCRALTMKLNYKCQTCCCFLQGDQGLPGEQGAPGDRGIGEAGPKVRTLHQVKLINSKNGFLYWCMKSTNKSNRHCNNYRENLGQLESEASLVFQERMEHQGRRQI